MCCRCRIKVVFDAFHGMYLPFFETEKITTTSTRSYITRMTDNFNCFLCLRIEFFYRISRVGFLQFYFHLTIPLIGFTHIPVLLLSFIGSYCYPTYFSLFFRVLICIQCSLGILQHFLQLLVGFIKLTHLLTQVFALCLSTQRVNSLFTR